MHSHAVYTLREITSHYNWEIMCVLVERPATVEQLVEETGFSRNKVLAVTKSLSTLGLIERPRRRKGITGLIVAKEPQSLSGFMAAYRAYYFDIRKAEAEAVARDAERLRVLMAPKPPWTPTLLQGGAA